MDNYQQEPPAPAGNIFDRHFLRRPEDLTDLYMALLKGGLDKAARDQVGRAAAHLVTLKVKKGHSNIIPALREDEQDLVNTLSRIGYAITPDVFSAQDIAEIKRCSAEKMVGISAYGKEARVPFRDVPSNANFAHFEFHDIGGIAPIYRLIHDESLIRTMAHYLGAPPSIGIVGLWWSYPTPGAPEGMQMYHHDRGDFRSCNLFTYLTDVDMGTGPHAFVDRTHSIKVLGPLVHQRYAKEPNLLQQFWQWMEQHRKTDAEVLSWFSKDDVKFFTGPQGTSFLEDTRGLHKGTRPTTGPRMAFEIFFGVMPKYNESIVPLRRSELDLPADLKIPTEDLHPLVRYATRQFYV